MTAILSLADFAPYVGETFALETGEARLALVLEEAKGAAGASVREHGAFTLLFRGPADPVLPQAIYRLDREAESHDIFLVPIARDAEGTRYEAVFN